MTNRAHSFLVILDEDIREDDLDPIVGALKHIKGVLDVQPIISTYDSQMAKTRASTDIRMRILEMIKEL